MLVLALVAPAISKGVLAVAVHLVDVPLPFITSSILPPVCALTLMAVIRKLTIIGSQLHRYPHGRHEIARCGFSKRSVNGVNSTRFQPVAELAHEGAAVRQRQMSHPMLVTVGKLARVK